MLITLYVTFGSFNSCKVFPIPHIPSFSWFIKHLTVTNICILFVKVFNLCLCFECFLLVISWLILWNWNNNYKLFVTWLIKISLNTLWTVVQHSILLVSEPSEVESTPARLWLASSNRDLEMYGPPQGRTLLNKHKKCLK